MLHDLFFRQGFHLVDIQGPRGGVDGGGKEPAAAGGRRGADQGQGGEAADSDSRTEVRWSLIQLKLIVYLKNKFKKKLEGRPCW